MFEHRTCSFGLCNLTSVTERNTHRWNPDAAARCGQNETGATGWSDKGAGAPSQATCLGEHASSPVFVIPIRGGSFAAGQGYKGISIALMSG